MLVVWLPSRLAVGIKERNPHNIEECAAMLDGAVIYDHAFSPPDEWGRDVVAVTLDELEEAGVIRSVTLHREVL